MDRKTDNFFDPRISNNKTPQTHVKYHQIEAGSIPVRKINQGPAEHAREGKESQGSRQTACMH